jgi:hypothetical protein
MLVHFHVLVSIGASILLAEMLYPGRRKEAWLGTRGLIACIAGLALWFPAGWLMTAYIPPWPGYLLSWVAGGLGFFILLNFTSDLEAFTGKSCVSAIAVIGLIVFGLVVGRRRREIIPSP